MRVICIGECMVEMRSLEGDLYTSSFAGDVYNTAVYLKRDLPDAQVQLLTAVGDDPMSRRMREHWRKHGIDDALAFTVNAGTPGLYLIEIDAFGERRFHYWRRESAARHWLAKLLDHGESSLFGADLIYISGISLAIVKPDERRASVDLLQRLRGRVGRIAFDPNVRPNLWETRSSAMTTIRSAIAAADIVLPSVDDLTWMFEVDDPNQQLELLRKCGAHEIALTLGSRGCLLDAHGSRMRVGSASVADVVDTTGAGDAFNGAYLARRICGGTRSEAATAGLAVATRVVTHTGAIVPYSVSHPGGQGFDAGASDLP